MKLEIVEKKNYTEVYMWRSTFKIMSSFMSVFFN